MAEKKYKQFSKTKYTDQWQNSEDKLNDVLKKNKISKKRAFDICLFIKDFRNQYNFNSLKKEWSHKFNWETFLFPT